MQWDNWLTFASIALIATITPGPAVLLVSSHSLMMGPLRSLVTIAGNISGLFIMSAGSVLGLSALILVSATAFMVLKLVGAAYLVYLGVKLWRKGVQQAQINHHHSGHVPKLSLYSQGLLVSLTNPKAIMFTTALFPQFIELGQPLLPQFGVLVATFMLLSFICLSGYALLSHKATKNASIQARGKVVGKLFGATFVSAGVLLATTTQK